MLKNAVKTVFRMAGYKISKFSRPTVSFNNPPGNYQIPDQEFYRPLFSPWYNNGTGEFKQMMREISGRTLVSPDRCFLLYLLAKQSARRNGHFYECGVYKGGTARLLANILAVYRICPHQKLCLFDSFAGMPDVNPENDLHRKGDFADTTLDEARQNIGFDFLVEYNKGLIPQTFKGKDADVISLAHIDVDIYQSVLDCCEFIYPRLLTGGIMVFDDYGFPTCPGARKAVDEFFENKPEIPIVIPSGQAIIFKI